MELAHAAKRLASVRDRSCQNQGDLMPYEIDFLPVGDSNGDAIVIRYDGDGGFYLHIVDGGFVDTADVVIKHIEQVHGTSRTIHHVVLSHADNDHAAGLIDILEHFAVGHIWMNRPWRWAAQCIDSFHGNYTADGLVASMRASHSYLVEIEKIAQKRGIPIHDVFQGAQIGPFRVLAPSWTRYVKLIPDLDKTPMSYAEAAAPTSYILKAMQGLAERVKEALDIETLDANPPATSASNETSVVQLAVIDGRRILLTADVGPDGLTEAANYAATLGLLAPPHVAQIPHHGSRRNVTPAVLNRWLGGYPSQWRGNALVSVGEDADIYPRRKVKNAFIRRGYPVYATRGKVISERHGYPTRPGWGPATAEEFSPDVHDE
jgi:beta-lactamase superfamily II metal-dependent hydrolase